MDNNNVQHGKGDTPRRRWWQRRWFHVTALLVVIFATGFLLTLEYLVHNAEPILRDRIVETLSDRFDAPVELDRVDISLFKGVLVTGYGLSIPFPAGLQPAGAAPMLRVERFSFRTRLRGMLRSPMHVAAVEVEGMELHIPPPSQRRQILGTREGRKPADPQNPGLHPRIAIVVNELHCRNVRLFIESGKPGKDPLFFNITALAMRDVGSREAMLYDAVLTNPKPFGLIHATGHFGPWAGVQAAPTPASEMTTEQDLPDPGQTPLDGKYTFSHADLNTIRGIGGTLSSTGRFAGVLDRITVDGAADVPDFSLDLSDRPVPLKTTFHAVVDGTDGDTYLQPVHARLAHSDFTVSGHVVKIKGQGHDIRLDVDIPAGHMADFLRLAVKTSPPVMDGTLAMQSSLHIPPGHERVPLKMAMDGAFHLTTVKFNNMRWQDRLDGLSARATGHPEEVSAVSRDHRADTHSAMAAHFTMAHGLLTVTGVDYTLPGAQVLLNGIYSMDGRLFEFKGHVRTEATASQMVTGWKSWLIKPVDRFFRKDGAGFQLPVAISGTGGDLHFGLALHGTDDTPRQMLEEVRSQTHRDEELQKARKDMDRAAVEDARAASHAASLEDATEAHQAAVRYRADAERRLRALDAQGKAQEH